MEFDFSQNTKVADINKIPQDFRGLYKQDGDNGYVLDGEDAKVKSAVSAITGLNSALKAARAEAKSKGNTVDLTPLKEYGATPDEIATSFQTSLKTLQEQVKGVNIDKIKEDLAKQFTKDIDTHKGRATSLEKQLYKELVEGKAVGAISEAKGKAKLLLPFVTEQVKTVEANGKYQVVVVDKAGDIRYSGVTGGPMSIKELVAEMKTDAEYSPLFESEIQEGGGGAAPAAGQRKPVETMRKQERSDMTPTARIAAGLSNKKNFIKG